MSFDENLAPDVHSVLNATALLDVTEWDFFNLAYDRWHGGPATEGIMEPIFANYMFHDIVPPWVRHFARLVERLYRRGVLDREALGVDRLPGSRQMVSRGMRYGVLIVVVITALIVFGEVAARLVKIGERCFFPPCY